jgi:patatin-like phospholipase/acyl hydrolase
MNNEIKVMYKGITIFLLNDEWLCEGDFGRKTNYNLRLLKESIDKALKTKFKRYDMFLEAWNSYKEVTVTSITEDGEKCWIIDKDKNRQKVDKKKLFEINDKSKELISKYIAIRYEKNKIDDEFYKKEKEIKEKIANLNKEV